MSGLKLALTQFYGAWRAYQGQRRFLEATPGGRTLLITGPYRSGTSWVGQMLAGPGVWHLHEPFNPHHGVWPEYFSYRRCNQKDDRLDEIVMAMNSGRFIGTPEHIFLRGIPANLRGMPARRGLYGDAIKRILIKDPIACLLSEYLVRNHEMTAVLVLRHPSGFASSLSKLGWDTAAQLRNLLARETLMEDWLAPFESLMAAQTQATGLKSHVTLFAALWTVLWGFAQRNVEFLIVNYKDLCEAPEREFERLHAKLNLPYKEEDRLRHIKLTRGRGTSDVTSPFDVVRDTRSVRRSWSRSLSSAESDTVRSVWESFELPFFQGDDAW